MATLATIVKSPTEVKRVQLDYDDWLDDTDNLTSATATVTGENPEPHPLIPYAFISEDGRSVYLHLSQGNAGDFANVLVSVRTAAVLLKEVCIAVNIQESCA